jgi:hypothetical protein
MAAPADRLSGAALVRAFGARDTPIFKFNRSCHGHDSDALDGA